MKTRIVIVGGGTAGWLTAGIIAAKHSANKTGAAQTEIILVESPDVKNLGVGEGTWPTMQNTLRKIGISEKKFLSCCDASFKQASKFVGWRSGNDEHYYHPFTLPMGYGTVNAAEHWLVSDDKGDFESWVSAQGEICKHNLAPKLATMPEYAYALNYGYHLNAGKFVTMLQQHCVDKLKVKYIQGHVEHIISKDDGDIASIVLADGQHIEGDLFIDCSGFAAILIGKHYQIPFISQQHILFNDTALAVQIDHISDESPIASCTVATAQESGWIWDISLQNRRGIGHVFSSDFCSTDSAEEALVNYVKSDPHLSSRDISARKIKFNPGHRKSFWHKNCVAVGVSAGFVEPLEATALVLIEKSAEWICEQLPRDRQAMTVLANRFNNLTLLRWQEIIDFLKLHYVLTSRNDSEYWQQHQKADSIPDSLQDALTLWRYQAPGLYESNQRFELFSSASKQYVLYGMGFLSAQNQNDSIVQKQDAMVQRLRSETLHKTEKLLNALPLNRQLLNKLKHNLL
ncbi:tryptophan 7-halogenase [Alteromonas stellipolaris]|uniref:tryptophan halogenase family protein n=1 Tax=Alteromonas stellipolaris TaxID=233316 RepID=UPI002118C911|nr:tryptophan halogenase family protein [Alteromonas stellipolaris]MCQ8848372.1 tryptophan 7-halogenase [Alteromonas stellipolaris]